MGALAWSFWGGSGVVTGLLYQPSRMVRVTELETRHENGASAGRRGTWTRGLPRLHEKP